MSDLTPPRETPAQIMDRILRTPIPYRLLGEETPTIDTEPHDDHQYSWSCAVCRCAQFGEAMLAVIEEIVRPAGQLLAEGEHEGERAREASG